VKTIFIPPMPARSTTPPWSIYLIRTGDGALYTGITNNLPRRLQQHEQGRGAKALRGRGPLQLAFTRKVGSRSVALKLEARIKRLAKAQKEQLVQCGLPRGWLSRARQ
jgi:putative endonuclease